MAEPCWIITDPSGKDWDNGDYVPHFESNARAKKQRAELDRGYGVRRLDQQCITLPCSCCAAVLDMDGDGCTVHLLPGEAAEVAPAYDWTHTAKGWRCVPCSEGDCEDCAPAAVEEARHG